MSCAGSCVARSATAGCWVGASRSWPRPAQVVIDVMAEAYPHLLEQARARSWPRSPARRRSSRGRSTPASKLLDEAIRIPSA